MRLGQDVLTDLGRALSYQWLLGNGLGEGWTIQNHANNTFVARPRNYSGANIPAGQINATFRIANWGSVPGFPGSPDFSTGAWEGDMLKVTTTHLKEGWIRRNGVPRSEKATLVEYFIRHGDYLTLVTVVKDPVYLTEAFVRTSNWVLDPGFQLSPFSCIPTTEIERPRGAVPHHLPGTNAYLREFADKHGIPFDAARGGAATMYPDYELELQKAGAKQ